MIGRVEDFVVENGEIESETETDWMCWCEISLCDFGGSLIGLERLVSRSLSFVGNGEFCEVTVVVALPVGIRTDTRNVQKDHLHLVVEHLGFSSFGRWDQVFV